MLNQNPHTSVRLLFLFSDKNSKVNFFSFRSKQAIFFFLMNSVYNEGIFFGLMLIMYLNLYFSHDFIISSHGYKLTKSKQIFIFEYRFFNFGISLYASFNSQSCFLNSSFTVSEFLTNSVAKGIEISLKRVVFASNTVMIFYSVFSSHRSPLIFFPLPVNGEYKRYIPVVSKVIIKYSPNKSSSLLIIFF